MKTTALRVFWGVVFFPVGFCVVFWGFFLLINYISLQYNLTLFLCTKHYLPYLHSCVFLNCDCYTCIKDLEYELILCSSYNRKPNFPTWQICYLIFVHKFETLPSQCTYKPLPSLIKLQKI